MAKVNGKSDRMPISRVEWVSRKELRANAYNPNRCFSPEMALLKLSILSDGWTQPIVVREDGEIVDGFHRWTVSADPEVAALTDGLVPVVRLIGQTHAKQQLSTIRHNRARGTHGILKMATILRDLRANGMTQQTIEQALQMEDEEVERLLEQKQSPELAGKDSFGKGWVPDPLAKPAHAAKVVIRKKAGAHA